MLISQGPLEGLRIIELIIHRDKRGFFVERFNEMRFDDMEMPTRFIQDNHSRSYPGVIRGLHAQSNPPQGKLVGVLRGRIWDVAVDIRPFSATFGQHFGIELSAENGMLLWIPAGFAHGFCVLGDEPADVMYKVDNLYQADGEVAIRWNDPDLAIHWPVHNPIISDKDQMALSFLDYQLKAKSYQWPAS
jgi:dTDP-4-dehydrorhamnose 3,5-epimerase